MFLVLKALLGNLSSCFSTAPMTFSLHNHSQSLTCDHQPLLISCLASINKKVHFNSFLQHATSEPVLFFHSALISSVWISPVLCCLYYCSVVLGGRFAMFQCAKKKTFFFFFSSVVSKGSQPSKAPLTFPRLTAFVRSYTQGAMIVQIHVHVQY